MARSPACPGAKKALSAISNAENRGPALESAKAFADDYPATWPNAVAWITDDIKVLLAFYDYPPSFAAVRLRARVTEGPGSRAAGAAMVFN